jgi:hypothetical protein
VTVVERRRRAAAPHDDVLLRVMTMLKENLDCAATNNTYAFGIMVNYVLPSVDDTERDFLDFLGCKKVSLVGLFSEMGR